jgi:hypothetical protein
MPPLLWPITTGFGKPFSAKPTGRIAVVGNAFGRELECGALGGAAVPDAQNVMPAPVERQTRETKPRQDGRQEARCTDIEVHRVTVKQQHCSCRRLSIWSVKGAVER